MNDTTFGQSGEIPQLDGGNAGGQAGRQAVWGNRGGNREGERASDRSGSFCDDALESCVVVVAETGWLQGVRPPS